MIVYLIGITGAGKSTLGKQLAHKLSYDFIDLDDYIIAKEKKTIEQIFKDSGEEYFRKLEEEALMEINTKNVVISTGGGAPCFFDNMKLMTSKGKTIWLNPDPEIVTERLLLSENRENRPMIKAMTKAETLEFIKSKVKERQKFYSLSDIIIAHNNITVEMIMDTLS